ncbi:MAG: putative DNA polymerase [Prokaryotic dsDNA virus sp.]|jgi:DNA polymerase I-like protein with 3'-5' exonuclease and polymerase domains|nr:MAG: putative DNA polymerase [Prokaryotic dsDNA virus sp.]|tara:strand:- start:17244 stop:19106 length:1863 start_codon:yes stop_codon:yes gene_type:complete
MTVTSLQKSYQFSLKPNSLNDKWYVFDIETDGLYDDVTKIFCIVIYDVTRQQTFTYGPDTINDAIDSLNSADALIGHNIIFYDIPVLQKLAPNFKLNTQHVIDTLICTRLIWPKEKLLESDTNSYTRVPGGLKGSASLKAWGYRLSDYKIDFKDFSAFSEEMLSYCIQDVNVTTKLLEHIQKQTIATTCLELEHTFASCIERQIRSGFPFDIDAALAFVDELEHLKTKLETELVNLFPPIEHEEWFTPKVNNASRGYVKDVPFCKKRIEKFNPGSRQQIVQRLKNKYGWIPETRTEKGNPVLNDDVLEKLPYPEAKPLAEYMLLKKRLGQIKDGNNAWIKLVSPDGYIHGDVVTNGCITGRCSHRNPNTAQIPAAYSPYGKECRSLFHAPDDWILIGSDAKALELRCLAGYLAFWDDGEYGQMVTDDSVDIHTYNQEKFGVETRDISKRLLYAVLYGAGFLKAGSIVDPNEKDPDALKQLGKAAIQSFMNGVPALQKLKNKLAENLIGRGYLLGLDKRPLYCRSDFKALNVLLQSCGAILMKQVVINIHKNLSSAGLVYGQDWHQHGMIHDEIQLSCRPGIENEIIRLALNAFPAAGEAFNFQCKIEGDAKTGYTWYDTH